MNQIEIANRNIKLYIIVRTLAKRVFLPLTAIYFIDTAGFTIRDIGLLSAFYSLVQLLAEVPTGYFADRIGRVASIRLAALLATIATTIYVFIHNRSGIYVGVMFEALAYSFFGGAGEALVHDSLVVKKRIVDYTKIMSQTMSISLIGNAILVTLVPMTYKFNSTYPFAIGAFFYLVLFFTTFFMHDVERSTSVAKIKVPNLKLISGKKNILLFSLTFGIIAALFTAPADMVNVALKEYGIRVDLIGWIYGIGSVVGAGIGPFIHHLRRIKLSSYLLIDLTFLLGVYLAAYTRNGYLLGTAMILSISFWRYRRIIYQDYLLTKYPTTYKATLISAMNNLEQLNSVWLPLMITSVIYHTNTSVGLGLVGLFGLFIAPIFYFSTLKFFKSYPLPTKLANIGTDTV